MGKADDVAKNVWDLEFFAALKKEKRFTPGYRQHNAALKWFRDKCEREHVAEAKFSNQTKAAVAGIRHPKGMSYTFDESEMGEWSWWEMVAMLNSESMEFVVASDRSGGLVGCRLEPRPGSYDHKRHHEKNLAGRPETDTQLRVWDFVLIRKDGSGVRLHPQWSTPKVESYAVEGHDEEVQTPWAGLGGSDGPGTYKSYKEIGSQRMLRFGPQ